MEVSLDECTWLACHCSAQETPPHIDNTSWMPAKIPGTVLTTLVHNERYPQPYPGLNNLAIPDIGDVGHDAYCYWFTVKLPKVQYDEHLCLRFDGINYSCDIWINDNYIKNFVGMFLRHSVDITEYVPSNAENARLFVLVKPVDHFGIIPRKGLQTVGQGGDHSISQDVTMQFVEGWDWVMTVADRNTGIWDSVYLHATGSIIVKDPCVRVVNIGSMTSHSHVDGASFEIVFDIKNASEKNLSGKIYGSIFDEDGSGVITEISEFELLINLDAGIEDMICYNLDIDEELELWWPNGLGSQKLYSLEVDVVIDSKLSDTSLCRFGVRTLESYVANRTRIFLVNKERIFIRGGNWIASDAMLRLSKQRYQSDIRMHKEMGFNMIRVWGGSISEREDFYNACDEMGLLVWQEFWITGDNDGRGSGDSSYPLDHELFLDSALDVVKRLRKHPSLAIWVGGNEQQPCPELNEGLQNIIEKFDTGRTYVKGSVWGGFAGDDGGKGYLHLGDGPYSIQKPADFFTKGYYPYGFNPEIGSVGIPVIDTLKRVFHPEHGMPKFRLSISGNYTEIANSSWEYHKYMDHGGNEFANQLAMYGVPETLEDFADQAQLVNYVQYRALIEGWTSMMGNPYTGVLIWKTQNPWLGLRGQFYDWYHEQTAGFFGLKHALKPIHVQLNLNSMTVQVVNCSRENLKPGAMVSVRIINLEGEIISSSQFKIQTLLPLSVVDTISVEAKTDEVIFVDCSLVGQTESSSVVDNNFYWLSPDMLDGKQESQNALWDLGDLKKNPIDLDVSVSGKEENDIFSLNVTLENVSESLAFFVRMKVRLNDNRLLPVFYDDNYFSILSQESRNIMIKFGPYQLLETGYPEPLESDIVKNSCTLVISGWNVVTQSTTISWDSSH